MKGSGLALVSCMAAIASYFVQEPTVLVAMVASAFAVLMAAWWRGRPVLLLTAYILLVLSFVTLPQGLMALLLSNGIDPSQFTLSHSVAIVLCAGAAIGLAFAVSCRRQSGGVPLSAQEASEDLEKLVCFVGRATGLLYIPLICLPLFLAFAHSSDTSSPDLAFAFWNGQASQTGQPQVQVFSWLFTLLLLGGLASAYMRNAHHRYSGLRDKGTDRSRALLELIGAAFLLLPVCWIMIDFGWVYSLQVQLHPVDSIRTKLLMQSAHVPAWVCYAVLPASFFLLACAAISVMLRSLVYLFGPNYLLKRAATHLDLQIDALGGRSETQAAKLEGQNQA